MCMIHNTLDLHVGDTIANHKNTMNGNEIARRQQKRLGIYRLTRMSYIYK